MTRIAAQYLATIAFMMFNSSQQQPELARELELLKQKLPDDQKAFWMPLIEKVDGEMKACIVCIDSPPKSLVHLVQALRNWVGYQQEAIRQGKRNACKQSSSRVWEDVYGPPEDERSSMNKLTIRSNEADGASKFTNNEMVSSKKKMKDKELRKNSVARMNIEELEHELKRLVSQMDEPTTPASNGKVVYTRDTNSNDVDEGQEEFMTQTEASLWTQASASNECVNAGKKKKRKGLRRKIDTKVDGDDLKDKITLLSKPWYETHR